MSASELVERILSEGSIGMSQAAALVGTFKNGKRVSPSTVTRWISDGVKLPSGAIVKLEAVRIAGRLATSKAAVLRFIVAQQGQGETASRPVQASRRSPAQRQRDSEAAAAALKQLGV